MTASQVGGEEDPGPGAGTVSFRTAAHGLGTSGLSLCSMTYKVTNVVVLTLGFKKKKQSKSILSVLESKEFDGQENIALDEHFGFNPEGLRDTSF